MEGGVNEEFGHRVWKYFVREFGERRMGADIALILEMLDKVLKLEAKIEEAIASEKDKGRRKKLEKAFKNRDRDAVAALLFDN